MGGQHEGRLSVAIAGIYIRTPSKKIKDAPDFPTRDRLLPGGIHQSKTPGLWFCLAMVSVSSTVFLNHQWTWWTGWMEGAMTVFRNVPGKGRSVKPPSFSKFVA
jgi:hypothetical protein